MIDDGNSKTDECPGKERKKIMFYHYSHYNAQDFLMLYDDNAQEKRQAKWPPQPPAQVLR